ncbi:neprilysin-1-like [Ornithodoros turicata]|uniref:neprilysin-1-like n=1 Tax=Ornithodoros turicata TaxID=34597 RepID=UPI003139D225
MDGTGICSASFCVSTIAGSLIYASLFLFVPYLVTNTLFPTCFSPDCYNFPRELAMAMEPRADPCKDFYRFVCGRWSTVHPVDANQFARLQRKIFFSLYDEIHQADKTPVPQSSAVEKSALGLRICEEIFSYREDNIDDLQAFLKTQNLSWPDVSHASPYDALEALIALGLDWDIHLLFQMKLVPNFKQDDRLLLSLSQSSSLVLWFQHRVTRLPGSLLGDAIVKIAHMLGSTDEDYSKLVETIVLMDTDLMSMYLQTGEKEVLGYAKYGDLGNLSHSRIPASRWINGINQHLPEGVHVKPDSELYLIGTSYMSVTARFLSKYEKFPHLVRLLFGWHVVRSLIPITSYSMAKILITETLDTQMAVYFLETCVGRVSDIAPFALAHYYFNKFLPSITLRTVDALVNNIRETSLNGFRNLSWMEEQTRREATNKLASLHKIVAFPKDLSSRLDIDAYYSYLPEFKPPFLRTYLLASKATLDHTKPLLRGGANNSINRDLYLHAQLIPVNSFYMFVYHVMFIMPSIQFPPYYADSLPVAARYGGLGHVVGHEITHVFDPFQGSLDRTGRKVEWFSETSRLRFLGRLECLVRQYSAASRALRDLDTKTLSEDFADNSGFEWTFSAYRKQVTLGNSPSGVWDLTNDQLFYVTSCHKWCASHSDAAGFFYSPKSLRCNVPLMNSAEFGEAFQCPPGSPMNPSMKCTFG